MKIELWTLNEMIKSAHDITCFKIQKGGGARIGWGTTIRGNTVFVFDLIYSFNIIKFDQKHLKCKSLLNF